MYKSTCHWKNCHISILFRFKNDPISDGYNSPDISRFFPNYIVIFCTNDISLTLMKFSTIHLGSILKDIHMKSTFQHRKNRIYVLLCLLYHRRFKKSSCQWKCFLNEMAAMGRCQNKKSETRAVLKILKATSSELLF